MKIKQARYLLTAVKASQYPAEIRPAVSFCGRSNVGKSSLINALLNRRNLARTSSQPGKTRTINFFEVSSANPAPALWYLADLPGYGYARASWQERESWRQMVEEFLSRWPGPNLFLQLVDIRHEPSPQDKQMWQWLRESGAACALIATKADKISKGARGRHLAVIARALQVDPQGILPFSAHTREGREPLLAALAQYLNEAEQEGRHERSL